MPLMVSVFAAISLSTVAVDLKVAWQMLLFTSRWNTGPNSFSACSRLASLMTEPNGWVLPGGSMRTR